MLQNKLWSQGPHWLLKNEIEWPQLQAVVIDVPEKRNGISLITTQLNPDCIFERFSCIRKLNRIIAYALRFCNIKKNKGRYGQLTVQEIKAAHIRIIKLVQLHSFGMELRNLQNNKSLPSKSKIASLNPFTDEDGIIRVGGRLRNADISYSRKHPILLPRSNHITHLIIRHEHIKHFHAGLQATLNHVRANYWPIGGKSTIRKIIHECVRCSRLNPIIPKYVMGNLPHTRVALTRPFTNVGIDYCGPFFIKERKFRNKNKIKIYVATFVCFCTKAVHLELVGDLTSETCFAAIKRFIGRRGKPKHIYSDNGTNFVGTRKEMLEIYAFLTSKANNNLLQHNLADIEINWHFSPSKSPHFGDLWESMVKLLNITCVEL